jgi:hypothetical protein
MKPTLTLLTVLLLAPLATLHADEPRKPNVLFIIVDELSTSLGCGAKLTTSPWYDDPRVQQLIADPETVRRR